MTRDEGLSAILATAEWALGMLPPFEAVKLARAAGTALLIIARDRAERLARSASRDPRTEE